MTIHMVVYNSIFSTNMSSVRGVIGKADGFTFIDFNRVTWLLTSELSGSITSTIDRCTSDPAPPPWRR